MFARGPRSEGSTLGLMLCCSRLEVLQTFEQEPALSFRTGSHKLHSRSFLDRGVSQIGDWESRDSPRQTGRVGHPKLHAWPRRESEGVTFEGHLMRGPPSPWLPQEGAHRGFAEPSGPGSGCWLRDTGWAFPKGPLTAEQEGVGAPGEAAGCHLAHE